MIFQIIVKLFLYSQFLLKSKINLSYILSTIFLFAFTTFIPTIYPFQFDSNEIPAKADSPEQVKNIDNGLSKSDSGDTSNNVDTNFSKKTIDSNSIASIPSPITPANSPTFNIPTLPSTIGGMYTPDTPPPQPLETETPPQTTPRPQPLETETPPQTTSEGFVPFHFTAVGDFRDNTNTDENMAANNPEIILILGDFSYDGNAEQWWSKNMDALDNLNVIGALGNHDEPNDDFLNLWPLNKGKWEFIHKVGNVAFVAFDTEKNNPSTIDPLLAQAQADRSVEHIIPFGHKTVFTPTPGNPLEPDADREYFDLFKKYDKIRMILGGHNHFYARMNAVPGTDFIYVTAGNGGANPHQDSDESGSPPKQFVRSNGALHCHVNSDTISCKMISNEGKVWDKFTITPGNPPASDQDPAQAPNKVKAG